MLLEAERNLRVHDSDLVHVAHSVGFLRYETATANVRNLSPDVLISSQLL